MNITEFLLARIAEDERVAKAAPGPKWDVAMERTGEPGHWRGIAAYELTLERPDRRDPLSVGEMIARSPMPFAINHAARWDPARVLAECEAKRRIVHRASAWLDDDPRRHVSRCDGQGLAVLRGARARPAVRRPPGLRPRMAGLTNHTLVIHTGTCRGRGIPPTGTTPVSR